MSTKNKIRTITVSAESAFIAESAEILFEAGGKKLLDESTRKAVQKAVTEGAEKFISESSRTAIEGATKEVAKKATTSAAKEVTKTAVKTAGKEILKSSARAAGVGALIDAGFGSIESIKKYRDGEWNGKEATMNVVKEAGTGAAASGIGVAVAAGVVAVTGPVSIPILVIVGAGTSIAAKMGLMSVFS